MTIICVYTYIYNSCYTIIELSQCAGHTVNYNNSNHKSWVCMIWISNISFHYYSICPTFWFIKNLSLYLKFIYRNLSFLTWLPCSSHRSSFWCMKCTVTQHFFLEEMYGVSVMCEASDWFWTHCIATFWWLCDIRHSVQWSKIWTLISKEGKHTQIWKVNGRIIWKFRFRDKLISEWKKS